MMVVSRVEDCKEAHTREVRREDYSLQKRDPADNKTGVLFH